jgi:NitT/TauT family transport system permease protein
MQRQRPIHSADAPAPAGSARGLGWEHLLSILVLVLAIALWDLLVRWADYPAFFLPSPGRVVARYAQAVREGALLPHVFVTLREVLLGLALGLSVALSLGYALAKSRLAERVLAPYLVASQAIPTVALAPLLVIWFGAGSLSKVLVCALTLFFPVLINTIVGVRSVDRDLRDLMRSLRATRWQTFRLLEVPAALPVLFGGLKVGVTLSVIGAVVGEFVGSDRGLGFLVNLARGLFDTPLLFVALITLMIIALALYLLVASLEAWLLKWRWPE